MESIALITAGVATLFSVKKSIDLTKKDLEMKISDISRKRAEILREISRMKESEESLSDGKIEQMELNLDYDWKKSEKITIPRYIKNNLLPVFFTFTSRLFYFLLTAALFGMGWLIFMYFKDPANSNMYSEAINMIVSVVTIFSIIVAYHEFINNK